jgi:hypothetical protein
LDTKALNFLKKADSFFQKLAGGNRSPPYQDVFQSAIANAKKGRAYASYQNNNFQPS